MRCRPDGGALPRYLEEGNESVYSMYVLRYGELFAFRALVPRFTGGLGMNGMMSCRSMTLGRPGDYGS